MAEETDEELIARRRRETLCAAAEKLEAGVEHCGGEGKPHTHFTATQGFVAALTPGVALPMARLLRAVGDGADAEGSVDGALVEASEELAGELLGNAGVEWLAERSGRAQGGC